MKKILFAAFAVMLLGITGLQAQTQAIHCWDFNDSNAPANDFNISPISTTQRVTGNGTITHTFDQAGNFGGDVANACSGSIAGAAFCPQGGANLSNNGAILELDFPTTGFEQVQLSFWARRTGTGFDSVAVSYSLDGTNFTYFDWYVASTSVETFDFSAITGANDNADFTVRLTFFGATSQTGNNRIDNITLSGVAVSSTSAYAISDINGLDAQGVADSLGVSCAITGLVSGDNLRTSGVEFWFVSPTNDAGLLVRSTSLSGYTVTEGDELYVEGTVGQFRGLLQFVPDSIHVISTGNTLPTPAEVFSLGEATEGRLITIKNLNFTASSTWPTGSANLDVYNATDTFLLRINSATGIPSNPAPTGTFDLVGHGGQFNPSSSAPFLDGYQIQPRRIADFQSQSTSSAYTISDINGLDAQGVADSLGVSCAITGLVSGDNLRTSGVEFWFVSPTNDAGLLVRSTSLSGYTVTEGDELYVEGTVGQFRGLLQFVPDSIHVISTGNTLPTPAEVFSLGEATEGRLITIKNLNFTATSTWPTGSANLDVYNATDTFLLRINSATGIPSNPAPTGTFDLVGHGGQFNPSSSAPFLDGYQIQPRRIADFQPATGTTAYTIADITTVDATGVADSLGVSCAITGLVSGDNLRTSGVEFWFVSPSNDAGLLVRSTSLSTYTVTEGDALYISGTVGQFRGLIQFVPDSIHVISSSNALPTPAPITTLDDSTEGRLVEFPFLTLLSGWNPSGSGFNALVTDGTNNFTVRVVSATSLFNLPAPTTPFSLVGHGSQFAPSSTAPFVGGFQIQPRYASDLTPIIPTTPTVNFVSGATAHLENAGTVPVTVFVDPTATTAETVYISVTDGPNVLPGDYTTTPAAVGGVITLAIPANSDTVSFDLNIVDNAIQNPNKDITFTIDSATTGLIVGAIAANVVTLVDDDIIIPSYLIQDVATVDAQGVADSLGVMCKLEGIVLGVDMSGAASPALQFTIHNGTKGIGVFANAGKALPYTVAEGDEVRIIGTLSQFRGLLQIEPDSIVVISTGNPLPTTPQVVTNLGETTESELIRINGVSIVDPSQWTNSGSGMSVDVTDGVNTYVMRIDNNVDIFGGPIPAGIFDVIGIGGQFNPSSSAPFDNGYQILPRYIADIVFPALEELAITEIMPGSNDADARLRGDWFEITNYGTDPVTVDGFSWDNDTETPGITTFPNGITLAAGEAIVVLDIDPADTSDWKMNWRIAGQSLQIITSADLSGPFPNIKQGGDLVALYNATDNELCRASYPIAVAGRSVEFDTQCLIIGNAIDGTRGAYFSNGGDQGSPGNLTPSISTENLTVNFGMYPNPARTEVNIAFTYGAKRTVTVANMMGAIISETKTQEASTRIDVSALAAGVYIVHITENGATATRRLIVE